MRADGSHVRRITTVPAGFDWDGSPRFSPDGRRLVFTRMTRGQGAALFTTDLRGHTTQITSYATGQGMPSGHHTESRSSSRRPRQAALVTSTSSTRTASNSATSPIRSRRRLRPTRCGRQMGGRSSSFRSSIGAAGPGRGSGRHEIRRIRPPLHRGPPNRKPPTGLDRSPRHPTISRWALPLRLIFARDTRVD